MNAMFAAMGAGLRDIFAPRLLPLTILCVALAFALTGAAAWAAFRYLLPLIPESGGWIGWLLDAAQALAGVGVVILAIVLAPGVSMFLGALLFDVAAARVEKAIGAPTGRIAPLHEGALNGLRIALPAIALNLLALPLLFVPIVNVVAFLWLNGFLMGREYFSLAAVRRMGWAEARALRRRAGLRVTILGIVAAILPFVAPLYGASAMTRFVQALMGK
ncbi:MAG: EI24 domain-containing protein [Hyphomonadaceae bacterium]